jgi:hypothetical protein
MAFLPSPRDRPTMPTGPVTIEARIEQTEADIRELTHAVNTLVRLARHGSLPVVLKLLPQLEDKLNEMGMRQSYWRNQTKE